MGCSSLIGSERGTSSASNMVEGERTSYFYSNPQKWRSSYEQTFQLFKNKVCASGDFEQYQKYYKQFKGEGIYIPVAHKKMVREAIYSTMDLIDKKNKWIDDSLTKLQNSAILPNPVLNLETLDLFIDANLKIKFLVEVENKSEPFLLKEAQRIIKDFLKNYEVTEKDIFYLLNFAYPVDHLKNRFDYDAFKSGENDVAKQTLYVQRKMYEDGTSDEDGSSGDLFLRTTLDTFKLHLLKEVTFFSQETVNDWDFLRKNIMNQVIRGKKKQIQRLENWKIKLKKTKDFYLKILAQDKVQEAEYLSQYSEATKNLKDFVESKLGEVYKFWSDQPLELQQLFVMQTILIHEVGNEDPTKIERKTIAQVVKNRSMEKSYHSLLKDDPWNKYAEGDSHERKFWWLNLMFRRGEFSFMLFFIPSVAKVFCPSTAPLDVQLAEENLTLSIDVLSQKESRLGEENIFRYFSRVSMMGRIDMTSVWHTFTPISERPGDEILEPNKLNLYKTAWDERSFRYLYQFVDVSEKYYVLKIGENFVVMKRDAKGSLQFFHYRNPNLFRYFRPIK